jgi:uncharacterized membrane protein (UPF0136 family)
MVEQAVKRPKVRGTVILTAFLGFLLLLSAYVRLSAPAALLDAPQLGYLRPAGYISIALGILLVIDAVLIASYKRIGLFIGLLAYVLLLAYYGLLFLRAKSLDMFTLLTVILMIAAAYYLYKYLTHEPEKQFFT